MGKGECNVERVFDAAREDAQAREQMCKDMAIYAPSRKMNESERLRAIRGLNPQIRPRPLGMFKSFSSSAGLPASATMARIGMGDSVQLAGLRSRADLNGTFGEVVQDVPDAEGRIRVKLKPMKGSEATDKVMRVKKSNLHTMGWLAQAMGDEDAARTTVKEEMRKTWSVGDVNRSSSIPFSLGTRLQPLPHQRRGFSRGIGGRFNIPGLDETVRVGE
jgi:hypothetical protein